MKVKHKTNQSIGFIGAGNMGLPMLRNLIKQGFDVKVYDINPKMINYCKRKFKSNLFEVSDEPTEICDFTIISGTYNYAIYNNTNLWERYLIYNLKKCFMKSTGGLIFNLQVSSKSKIVNNIYYAGHDSLNKTLKKNFKNFFYYSNQETPNDGYYVLLRN